MRILQMARAAGKTHKLIKLSAERGAYIVCRDEQEAERIFQSALDRELDINFPITYSEFENKRYYGRGIKEFMIDDVDQLLECLARVRISYCTYTPT